ncbi:hypothetical protein FRACYDRAFT_245048 [Fragilariopsis cylindrus CCMP1102]|uniref:CRAL-TRIO domain-containing protein n=1 Tax=Fragilariopsis cylindrus CCMP1102 TaxID=635003 RepID=A0A1E7F1H9_9STRA|nr:hypothetical protein FRACYDRAFT_245048 [Fragilariopsis cylindrus CCMP1102]|eukprot:OEU11925.1 hypothetical protein FRACYDRAFT_245048 [Fragilariopsis cylindrus CCMP1102]
MSGSKLTKRERDWAFKLEEALYNNDNNSRSGGRFGSRLFNRGSSSVNVNVNGSSSSSSKTNSKSALLLYGKPSDLEIAAHAIRSKGNISKSLKRIRRLKQFKTMYQISDFNGTTGQDENENNENENNEQIITRIVTIMKKVFLVAYPNFLQKIGIDKHNRVVIMFRLCELRWTESPPFNHNNTERFQALYYLLWCIQPTVDSIRMGTVWIGDLQDIELGSTTSSSSTTNGVNNSNNIVTTTTTTTIIKPTSEIYIGGRLLLRDSYPIKVDDICVIDCPSKISKLYLYLYPFLSKHFLSKFVGVTSSQLQQHFSSELLSPRILNLKNNNHNKNSSSNSKKVYGGGGSGRNNRNRNNNKRNNNHHHHHHNNNSEEEENDDDWENLGDSSNSETNDDDHNNVNADVDEDEDNKPKLVTIKVNDNDNDDVNNNSVVVVSSSSDNSDNNNNENEDSSLLLLWTTIERLVRIRFDTERHFRL